MPPTAETDQEQGPWTDYAPQAAGARHGPWEDYAPPTEEKPKPPVESWWHRTFAPREVPHASDLAVGPNAKNHPMPGSFEGHPENVGEYAPATIGEAAGGFKDLATGYVTNEPHKMAHGVHRMAGAAGSALAPALPFFAAAAPIATGVTLASGAAGQKGAEKTAEYLGADPEYRELAGDVGAFAVGGAGAKLSSVVGPKINSARMSLAKKAVEPLVYEGVGEAGGDVRMHTEPERAVVEESLHGSKQQMASQAQRRIKQLKTSADNILQNSKTANTQLDVEKHIDAAIDDAIREAEKTAAPTSRLEALRESLKTKYGKLRGSPFEINELKTKIQGAANRVGAYRNTAPEEGTIADAMRDVANRIKNEVNHTVPEAAELNDRMSNLIDAHAGLKRNILADKGKSVFGGAGEHTSSRLLNRTLGSAPVRSNVARMLSVGQKAEVPGILPPAEPPDWITNGRLLPAPKLQLPINATPDASSVLAVEPATSVQRGAGGRMGRQATGMPKPQPVGWTADGGPIYEPVPTPKRAERPIEQRQEMNQLRVPPTGEERRATPPAEGGASATRDALVKAINDTLNDPLESSKNKAAAKKHLEDIQKGSKARGQKGAREEGVKGGRTERRSSIRDVQGPDLMRTARAQQLRAALEDPTLPDEDRAIMQAQLDDIKAHPFERHEGGDINSMKAKKTVSREEAERNTEKRKEGRKKRFQEK